MTTATTLGLSEPAAAAILGLTVLGEHLTATGLAGLGVLAIGLIILAGPSGSPFGVAIVDHVDSRYRRRMGIASQDSTWTN